MTTIVLDHLAGKHNRSAASLKSQMNSSVKFGATLIDTTEVNKAYRGKIPETLDGFGCIRGKDGWKGETAINYRLDTWTLRKRFLWVLDWDVYGPRQGIIAPGGVLEHIETGFNLIYTAVHLLSGWENDLLSDDRLPRDERENRAAIPRWAGKVAAARDKYGADGVAMAADWNVSMYKSRARNEINKLLGGVAKIPTPLPSGGTHGSRLIDMVALG